MNGGRGRLVIKNRIVRIWTSPNEKDIQNKKSLIIFACDCRVRVEVRMLELGLGSGSGLGLGCG